MEMRENRLYPTHLLCAHFTTLSNRRRDEWGRSIAPVSPSAAGQTLPCDRDHSCEYLYSLAWRHCVPARRILLCRAARIHSVIEDEDETSSGIFRHRRCLR